MARTPAGAREEELVEGLVSEFRETLDSVLRQRVGTTSTPSGAVRRGETREQEARRLTHRAARLLADYVLDDRNALAHRIGPCYSTEDLTVWLSPNAPLTAEAVRKRGKHMKLVAFLTVDRQWAYPAWQFTAVDGRLRPVAAVIEAWSRLPHGGALQSVDLVAWMHTRLRSLADTPAGFAARHGADAAALVGAVSRLNARTAGLAT